MYSHKDQARRADEYAFTALSQTIDQPADLDALALASTTDFRAAQARLARVLRIQVGQEKSTVRMRQLAADIREAEAQGKPASSVCLTQYGKSDNRQTRLDPIQQERIAKKGAKFAP